MIVDPLAIGTILAGIVALALLLEKRYRAFKALGAAILSMLLSSSLSNLGILPDTSPTIGGGMNLAALGRAFDTSNDLSTAGKNCFPGSPSDCWGMPWGTMPDSW